MELTATNTLKVLIVACLAVVGLVALINGGQGEPAAAPATNLAFSDDSAVVTSLDDDTQSGAGVCVYNNAWFVMRYQMKNLRTGDKSDWIPNYSAGFNKCMVADEAFTDLEDGDEIEVVSDVELGSTLHSEAHLVYGQNLVSMVDFKCTGTTLHYACNLGTGTTVENVTDAVAQFVEGFASGLSEELGFDDCIDGVDDTFNDITSISSQMSTGITGLNSNSILSAFELVGSLLKDFGTAIYKCVSASSDLVKKLQDIAALLTGNVESIVKTVVTDAIQILTDGKDITAYAKAVTADWSNGDYNGSGEAMGKIIGIMVEDLGRRRLL